MKLFIMTLTTLAQLAMPLTARADDDYLAKIAEITRREELLAQSKKLNQQIELIQANNEKMMDQMEPLRAELKAAQAECREVCKGPATRQALQSLRQLSETAVGASLTAGGARYVMKKWAVSKGETEGLAVISGRFKAITAIAIAASGAAVYASVQLNQYVDKRDEASREQIDSIKAEISAIQANLDSSNKNVARIVASNERITAALQADLTVMKEIQK